MLKLESVGDMASNPTIETIWHAHPALQKGPFLESTCWYNQLVPSATCNRCTSEKRQFLYNHPLAINMYEYQWQRAACTLERGCTTIWNSKSWNHNIRILWHVIRVYPKDILLLSHSPSMIQYAQQPFQMTGSQLMCNAPRYWYFK